MGGWVGLVGCGHTCPVMWRLAKTYEGVSLVGLWASVATSKIVQNEKLFKF